MMAPSNAWNIDPTAAAAGKSVVYVLIITSHWFETNVERIPYLQPQQPLQLPLISTIPQES